MNVSLVKTVANFLPVMSRHSDALSRYHSLGRRLRELRLKAGIYSQVELLDALAPHQVVYDASFWSRVESGQRRPSRDVLIKILKFFREKGVLVTVPDAQETMRMAGYASLDADEVREIFGDLEEAQPFPLPAPSPDPTPYQTSSVEGLARKKGRRLHDPRFDYVVVLVLGLYMLVLETWRNAAWSVVLPEDVNWQGIYVPPLTCALLTLAFYVLRQPLWRASCTLVASLASGLVLSLVFHSPGTIVPVLNAMGGFSAALLILTQGPSFILPSMGPPWPFTRREEWQKTEAEHDMAKSLLILVIWIIATIILIGIAMYIILFMSPPEAFGAMPHAVRVVRGIEILIALVMIITMTVLWGGIPLARFLSHPTTGEELR